jgi:hypothetical protein
VDHARLGQEAPVADTKKKRTTTTGTRATKRVSRPQSKPRRKRARRGAPSTRALCIGTLKGGFLLLAGPGRRKWRLVGPFHLGERVHDLVLDPRDGLTLLMSVTGGHLGPSIVRSTDRGRTWQEATRPPAFKKLPKKKAPGKRTATRGFAVKVNLWLTPGHASQPDTWYCGTSPQGLFRSRDAGATWKGVKGWNEGPSWWKWTGGGKNETPDGAFLHSVRVDPRDPAHLYLSLSTGGTFESHDEGRTWAPLNRGVEASFLPVEDPEFGQDPHCMILHPADPDRLYQQNHCGIYHLDRSKGERWTRIGRRMPRKVGDIGFPIVGHPKDPDTVWVFPMDGTALWPRTSPEGEPAVYRTRDGGKKWERHDAGLPREDAWFTVYRQAMDADDDARNTGVYFGTTGGEVWASRDGGESWTRIAEHLPKITAVHAVRFR